MKKILFILVLFSTTIALSQQKTFESEVVKISKQIDLITKTQKDSLKIKVIAIDKQLKNGEITPTTAQRLKKEAAELHAKIIASKVGAQERLLQQLVQDKTNGKIASEGEMSLNDHEIKEFKVGDKTFKFSVNEDFSKKDSNKTTKYVAPNKTTTQFIFALGVNNVIKDHSSASLNNSDYQFWQSHFYEVGMSAKTRFTKKPSQLYFKYGLSFLWNNLRLSDNRFHVVNGENVVLDVFPDKLSESRLRHVQMIFPMHIEWDLSKKGGKNVGYDRQHKSFRIGLGGFAGFKLGTRQYLEYPGRSGATVEDIERNNFNMNTINYGLSAYVGYQSTSLYLKYDMNPLFKGTTIRNVSMGVRFDFN